MPLSPAEEGFLIGILVGEGHFGGDGKQAQITLRMHVRHERLFRWLQEKVPGGRLYGPYNHGGRQYYQWMVRGSYLAETVMPIVQTHWGLIDGHVQSRITAMCLQYRVPFQQPVAPTHNDKNT
jgi:hypothetical protein